MHSKLTKDGRNCLQNNQLPSKSHAEVDTHLSILLTPWRIELPVNTWLLYILKDQSSKHLLRYHFKENGHELQTAHIGLCNLGTKFFFSMYQWITGQAEETMTWIQLWGMKSTHIQRWKHTSHKLESSTTSGCKFQEWSRQAAMTGSLDTQTPLHPAIESKLLKSDVGNTQYSIPNRNKQIWGLPHLNSF